MPVALAVVLGLGLAMASAWARPGLAAEQAPAPGEPAAVPAPRPPAPAGGAPGAPASVPRPPAAPGRADLQRFLVEERTRRAGLQAELAELRAAVAARSARARGLTLSGYLQADGVLVRQSAQDEVSPASGEPLNEVRALIRRARMRLTGERPWVTGTLELDGNTVRGMALGLTSAEVTLRLPTPAGAPPALALAFGLRRIPFGAELMGPDHERLFLERSHVTRGFFPGTYDLGVALLPP